MPLENRIQTLAQDVQADVNHQGRCWAAYNSTDATIQQEYRAEIRFDRKASTAQSLFVLQSNRFPHTRLSSLTVTALKSIASRVDNAYMTTNYRSVLNNQSWRTMFQVAQRGVDRIVGVNTVTANEDTMPCYLCGLVLPVGHITIDHHKPQTGGQHQAVLKVLRNINQSLTHSPGVGSVATAYANNNFQALPTKAAGYTGTGGYGAPQRYTLTDKGILFLSVALAASNENDIVRYCMHSAFNLKPYCAKCNIQKSNAITDLSWINS